MVYQYTYTGCAVHITQVTDVTADKWSEKLDKEEEEENE